jgi:uncharacterized protein (TIGR02118 family)
VLKLVFCCRRQPQLTREEFQRYWREDHARLVRSLRDQLPQMRRYVQSHALDDSINDFIREGRGTGESYDGITEVWFDDLDSMTSTTEDGLAAAQRLLEDEATFLDFARCAVFLTEEFDVF